MTALDHLVENFGAESLAEGPFLNLEYEEFADRVAEYIRGEEVLRAKPVRSSAFRPKISRPREDSA